MKNFVLITQIQFDKKQYLPIEMVGNSYPTKATINEILDFLNSTIKDYFFIDIIGYVDENKKEYYFNTLYKKP